MAAASPVRPGDLIGDRYRVERAIGQGGMALVVAAIDERLDERVAIKVLLPERVSNPEACARFVREARTAVKIKNPHVVRVTDVGTLDDGNGTPYMVMEYLDGEDLASLLRRKGNVPATTAMFYVLQVCSALKDAHALGIVHRDLKPANLFLVKIAGQPPALKILDFGISKIETTDRRRTETKEILGSPWYMAPEQMKKASSADARSDIWSLGIILHELVTGEVPFDGESMTEVIVKVLHDEPRISGVQRELPSRLEAIIRRCLSKDPEDRFPTADDLAAALQSIDAGAEMPPLSIERVFQETPLPQLASPEENDDAETVDPSELLSSMWPAPVASEPRIDDDDDDAEVVDPSEVLLSSVMPPAAAAVDLDDGELEEDAETGAPPTVRDSDVELLAASSSALDAEPERTVRDSEVELLPPSQPVSMRPELAATNEDEPDRVRDSDVELLPPSQPPRRPPDVAPKPQEERDEEDERLAGDEDIESIPPSAPMPPVEEDDATTEIAPPVASVRRSKQPPTVEEARASTPSAPPSSAPPIATTSRTPSIPPAAAATKPPEEAPRKSRGMIFAVIAAAVVLFLGVRFLGKDSPPSTPPGSPSVIATPTNEPAPPSPPDSTLTPPVPATAADASEEPLPIIYDAAPRLKPAIALRPRNDDEGGAAPLPSPTRTETPTAAPAPTKEDDDATVAFTETRRHQATLKTECWDTSDKTSQVVNVTALVDPSGAVTSATATSPDTKLAQCVQGQVSSWTFPASKKPRALAFPVRFHAR